MAIVEAIFTGANTHSGVSDFNPVFKEIAFGGGNNVAIWHPLNPTPASSKGISYTLKGHTNDVLNVKYCGENGEYLVTSSADQSIKVWSKSGGEKFSLLQSIDGIHSGSIYCLSVFTTSKGDIIMASGCAEGKISLWGFNKSENKFLEIHSFKVKASFYSLALALQEVAPGKFCLFVGGTKSQLYVYSFETIDLKLILFEQSAVLPGHENWVKTIVIKRINDKEFFIASGSLDRYIRIWKLVVIDSSSDVVEGTNTLSLLSNKKYKFTIGENFQCSLNFDVLILGHDDWISCLNWRPASSSDNLQLLSTSADTSIMVWEPDTVSGVWVTSSRLGELSIKGASTATGASGGFWSSIWHVDSESNKEYIFTHGKTGSWRIWSKNVGSMSEWDSELAITGPIKEVTDIQWSHNADYLLSTSLDQTTRLYAKWTKNADGSRRKKQVWREFSRPQIHGYDMICVGALNNSSQFVSGGDEKVMRSFNEPKSVANLLNKFCDIHSTVDESYLPEAASLPVLGLSNKAESKSVNAPDDNAETDEKEEDAQEENISGEVISTLTEPPLEYHLQRHTLWPEIEKIYGHGYELVTLDVSHNGKFIVSCCKSNNLRHAVLRLFDTKNWLEIRAEEKQHMEFHELTVNRVRFSKDDKYIMSVSRDRKVGIWRYSSAQDRYELWKGIEKAHTRIIWDGDWAPRSKDSNYYFVTGSRDKSIKVWEVEDSGANSIHQVKFSEPVTAISVYNKHIIKDDRHNILIAVGLESGALAIYLFDIETQTGKLVEVIDKSDTPSGRVSRLSWRNIAPSGNHYPLAVASADRSVRIYSVSV